MCKTNVRVGQSLDMGKAQLIHAQHEEEGSESVDSVMFCMIWHSREVLSPVKRSNVNAMVVC